MCPVFVFRSRIEEQNAKHPCVKLGMFLYSLVQIQVLYHSNALIE